MWNTRIFDTKTGAPVLRLDSDPVDARWSSRLGAEGSGSHSFSLFDLGLTATESRSLFEEQNRTVVACWGDHVSYSGVIQEAKFIRKTSRLTVGHDQLRTFWRARMQFGVGAASGGTLTVTNKSFSGAVRAILARAMQHSAEWTLPIDLPADGAGTFSATWDWWRFLTIDDLLTEIEEQGVEIDFRPYIDGSGNLRYQTVVGQPIVGATVDLPVSVDDSRVSDLEVTRDGSKRVTGVIVAGEGTEAGTLTAWAGNGAGTNPIPIRDVYRSQKDIDDPARLQAIADQMYAEQKNSVEQWSFDLQLSDEFGPEFAAIGRLLKMDVRGDLWIPDGAPTNRVIALSGGLGMSVKPEVQRYA